MKKYLLLVGTIVLGVIAVCQAQPPRRFDGTANPGTLLTTLTTANDPPGELGLVGKGTVTVEPDVGYIRLGVVSRSKDPQSALDENSAAMNKLYATLDKLGVTKKEIRTSDFSIYEDFKNVKRVGGTRNAGETTEEYAQVSNGFVVSNQVNITVCDLKNFGKILTAAVADGANKVNGISFSVKDRESKLDEARKLACADAKRKAGILAEGLGVQLGEVKNISESVYTPRSFEGYSRALGAAAQDAPISGGSMELTVNVNVTWKLTRGK